MLQPRIAPRGMRVRVTNEEELAVGEETRANSEGSPEFARRLTHEWPTMFRFARHLCGRVDEAEELSQDAAKRALERQHTYDVSRPLRGWLLRITFRLFLDRRKAASRAVANPRDFDFARLPSGGLCPEEASRVRAALLAMPVRDRDVLVAFHVGRESIAELAARYAIPENTLKSILHRARKSLAEAMER